MIEIAQKSIELERLARRLQVVRDLAKEPTLGVWAYTHWRTVERRLERQWQFITNNGTVGRNL